MNSCIHGIYPVRVNLEIMATKPVKGCVCDCLLLKCNVTGTLCNSVALSIYAPSMISIIEAVLIGGECLESGLILQPPRTVCCFSSLHATSIVLWLERASKMARLSQVIMSNGKGDSCYCFTGEERRTSVHRNGGWIIL